MNDLVRQIEQAQGGNLTAFGEIVREFQNMAYGCAYAVLGDFHLAEDAAQEAYIEAFRTLSDLRDPQAFPGWFRRIVLGRCNRITRKRKLPTVRLDEAAAVGTTMDSPDRVLRKTATPTFALPVPTAKDEDVSTDCSLPQFQSVRLCDGSDH